MTLREHINNAMQEAVRRNIKANMIVLSEGFKEKIPELEGLAYSELNFGGDIQAPMILGLEVQYDDALPKGVNFALVKGVTTRDKCEKLQRENKELKDRLDALRYAIENLMSLTKGE